MRNTEEILALVDTHGDWLECYLCSEKICHVYEMDLEGSYFVCSYCMRTHKQGRL